jgi:fermentation-respiration switch protein FrsA (DUF1100 family)
LIALAVLPALYLVLSPRFNYALYRPLLFHPDPFDPGTDTPPVYDNCQSQELFFSRKSRGKLCGWFFKTAGADQIILFSHGNAGNVSDRNYLVELQVRAGASVFAYDYSGFGKSDGLPTIEGICDDGLAAFDYVVNELGYQPCQIITYGESLGGAVAAYLSTQRKCGGIIIQSGFESLRRIALEIFPSLSMFPEWLFPPQPLDSIGIVRKPHPPLLIVHGVLDQVVPYEHGKAVYDAACGPKELLTLPSTGHNDISSTAPHEYVQAVRRLLEKSRAQPSAPAVVQKERKDPASK